MSASAGGHECGVTERSPEERRRLRKNLPAFGFVGGILGLAALVAIVVLVIWAIGGCGAEGAEGSLGL